LGPSDNRTTPIDAWMMHSSIGVARSSLGPCCHAVRGAERERPHANEFVFRACGHKTRVRTLWRATFKRRGLTAPKSMAITFSHHPALNLPRTAERGMAVGRSCCSYDAPSESDLSFCIKQNDRPTKKSINLVGKNRKVAVTDRCQAIVLFRTFFYGSHKRGPVPRLLLTDPLYYY